MSLCHIEKFIKLATQFFPVKHVYLLNDPTNGTFHSDFDINLLVVVDQIIGDISVQRIKLGVLALLVDKRIEPLLLDARQNKYGYLEEVRENSLEIYPNCI